jgi:hypothetical protein
MDKELEEMQDFRKDIDKIKIFCAYVASAHKNIPLLNRVWNATTDNFIYEPNTRYDDLDLLKAAIMKALLELEDRIGKLEANVALERKP